MSLVENFFKKNQICFVKIEFELIKLYELKRLSDNQVDIKNKIVEMFDKNLGHLLSKTFSQPVVVWHAEAICEEILISIHDYFRNKSCNIENVILLLSSSGVETYYKEYCKLNRTRGMKIVEIPLVDLVEYYNLENLKTKKIEKNLKKIFSFYGGTYKTTHPTRTFLSLFLAQYKEFASIEIISECEDLSYLENWLEYETFFLDYEFVKKYVNLYKEYINSKTKLFDDSLRLRVFSDLDKKEIFGDGGYRVVQFGQGNHQEKIDSHCLMTLVRETVNFQPFLSISEKTFKCFYNHTIPIPIDGKETIQDLKNYGFWIDEDFFDYSYLQEDFFLDKVRKLNQSIDNITAISFDDLNTYYYKNIEKFQHNQDLVVNWTDTIQQKLEQSMLIK